jgi:hypothetical protein
MPDVLVANARNAQPLCPIRPAVEMDQRKFQDVRRLGERSSADGVGGVFDGPGTVSAKLLTPMSLSK